MTDPSPELPVESISDDAADDLALALRLADIADAISLPRFGAVDLQVRTKPDLTPVSDADTAVERALRTVLAAQRPQDAVLGEEYGDSVTGDGGGGGDSEGSGTAQGTARRRWVIDPIDGTKNFVRGVPVWATLIALLDGESFTIGVVSAPALARRWWAAAERGAFTRFADNPARPCRVSQVGELADASLSFSEMSEWREPHLPEGLGDAFGAVCDTCWRTRAYGDFYSYVLVAEGAVDIAAEPDLSLWDLAALVPIVTEAGGRMTDVQGQPSGALTTSALATNGLLHGPVLAVLRGGGPRTAPSE
ncbi:MAG TPA: inositol monophosphatase family protein [Nakamurella sp.]|nr:inositol monophosphatase family protein [Nakamurella sp.]